MTGKDKTGDQLVASIRKTKQAATTRKKASVRKSQPKQKPASAAAAPKAPATASKPKGRQKPAAGTYQQGKRVWPD